ncbi:hypothetical protein EYB53_011270 [Candidatus Chloroploca sp. M-50]|uniref:Uncharacterized protein n=1 Tax=Candidatus Chloroploca mongolica TaxID=2528176 RepID=A0ABS4DA29_9CHLR|nr:MULTISPECIES: hypothetical protein [Candidatus Chloroploca]MBP1466286.1 hypothetical protein [Candidatus Chloroploca mongolica]
MGDGSFAADGLVGPKHPPPRGSPGANLAAAGASALRRRRALTARWRAWLG